MITPFPIQEALKEEEQCIRLIFIQNYQRAPESEFSGSEIVISLSDKPLLPSEFPVAQPGFPQRTMFRQGFDIVTSPFLPSLFMTESPTEGPKFLRKEENIKVRLDNFSFVNI